VEPLELCPKLDTEDGFVQSSLFKDESKLSEKWMPDRLFHRDDTFRQLMRFFRVLLERPKTFSVKVMLTGGPGSGKTAVAMSFGSEMECIACDEFGLNLKFIHVNCIEGVNLSNILLQILQKIRPSSYYQLWSAKNLIREIQDILRKDDLQLIICLDDADSFFTKKSLILNRLMNSKESCLNTELRISFVLNVKSDDVRENVAEKITSIPIMEYVPNQLEDILEERVKISFQKGSVQRGTVRLIAGLCRFSGSAREALSILWGTAKFAEKKGASVVEPSHVRQYYESLKPITDYGKCVFLDQDQKVILFAILRLFEYDDQERIKKRDIWREYLDICMENAIVPKKVERILMEMWILEWITGFFITKESIKSDYTTEKVEEIALLISIEELHSIVEYQIKSEVGWNLIQFYFKKFH